MMKQKFFTWVLVVLCLQGYSQEDSLKSRKKRLDFAKTYFETGGTFLPSFSGKRITNGTLASYQNPSSVMHYLNWGGFHFWGHGEFYVTIPLGYYPFQKNEEASAELLHSVTTGFRLLPWAYREKKIRPYIGVSWSALDFKQKIKPDNNQPVLSKDIMAVYDAGLLYGLYNFSVRLGLNYYADNKWMYPLSRTVKGEIKTPNLALQVGLLYTMDFSKDTDEENIEKWNAYPRVSKHTWGATKFGDFFVGIGPSISYTLLKSEYNQTKFPYLKDKLTSKNYLDIALGYHFQRLGLFTALSFRNPKFETEGFGAKQTIRKTSLALELNKFLMDYSGFTPYIGINVAYDRLRYTENIDDVKRQFTFDQNMQAGITLGWDIQPGKHFEALQLRTNLRWYPFSSFKLDGLKFNFNQLEYNLIQIVFYPSRLKLE